MAPLRYRRLTVMVQTRAAVPPAWATPFLTAGPDASGGRWLLQGQPRSSRTRRREGWLDCSWSAPWNRDTTDARPRSGPSRHVTALGVSS